MRESIFTGQVAVGENDRPMTLAGTLQKTGLLLVITIATAVLGWMFPNPLLMIASVIVGLVLGLVTGFKPTLAPVLSPAYAVMQGYFVGAISLVTTIQLADTQYSNAVAIAAGGTFITLAVMLALYAGRVIRVTDTVRGTIIGLTLAVGIFYLVAFLASFVAPQSVAQWGPFTNGPIGIAFSIFVIGLAAFNFLLDFDLIERGIESRAPSYMEWYGAFGLLVTMIWLYLEILRLLRKLAGNR